jgi:hypothetical protein
MTQAVCMCFGCFVSVRTLTARLAATDEANMRGRSKFKQSEVARAVRAVQHAGIPHRPHPYRQGRAIQIDTQPTTDEPDATVWDKATEELAKQ